jgi:flagellar hook-associated protein FlgK
MSRIAMGTGLRALLAAQAALQTTGQNVANANTPGYSKQRVDLNAARSVSVRGLLVGTGVDATAVRRTVDQLLERRILGQMQVGRGLQAQLEGAREFETLFAEPNGQGLGDLIDNFFSDLSQLSGNPADGILRTNAVQGTIAMTSRFQALQEGVGSLKREIGTQLAAITNQVNQLSGAIGRLNGEITQLESTGVHANELRDQRQVLLKQLAGFVDIQTQEDDVGAVRVLVAGNMLVNGNNWRAMSTQADANGDPRIRIEGVQGFVKVQGGSIGGMLTLRDGFMSQVGGDLDQLAKQLIQAVNSVHATGIPADGSFQSLVGANAIQDQDGDGQLRDELLSKSGLPFQVESGKLYVNVENRQTGKFTKHAIDIDATRTTVGQFIDALQALPNLSASLDAFGRVQILADAGFGLDFSGRIDNHPNTLGTLGGGHASLGSSTAGPFALPAGASLGFSVEVGGVATPFDVPLPTSAFANPSQAAPEEVVAALMANADFQAAGLRAVQAGSHVFIQSEDTGPQAGFTLTGGSAAGAFGWAGHVGQTINGSSDAVAVEVQGNYIGSKTDQLQFVPNMDGVVGTTPGLAVDVLSAEGQLVGTLLVGAGYQPGQSMDLGQGLSVSFSLGELSASTNDRMVLDVVADSDTSGVLVALGLNSLLVGSGAEDIAVRKDVELDPGLLAISASGAAGDGGKLLELIAVAEQRIGGLGDKTLGEAYGAVVGDIGFHVANLNSGLNSNSALLDSLETRRESLSGVNMDEELVDLVRFEQAYSMASQLLRVVNELHGDLLRLL